MAKILVNKRYVHHGVLASNCWALRQNITFYDGLYAALAAQLDLPLFTNDAELAKAPGLPCEVELVA